MPPSRPDSGQVDLHGMHPDQALRRLAQALHAARVRRDPTLTVITGKGWGNRERKPILRARVEAWLSGPDGQRLGVTATRVARGGGAIELTLGS